MTTAVEAQAEELQGATRKSYKGGRATRGRATRDTVFLRRGSHRGHCLFPGEATGEKPQGTLFFFRGREGTAARNPVLPHHTAAGRNTTRKGSRRGIQKGTKGKGTKGDTVLSARHLKAPQGSRHKPGGTKHHKASTTRHHKGHCPLRARQSEPRHTTREFAAHKERRHRDVPRSSRSLYQTCSKARPGALLLTAPGRQSVKGTLRCFPLFSTGA